jgi:hypothetical protein
LDLEEQRVRRSNGGIEDDEPSAFEGAWLFGQEAAAGGSVLRFEAVAVSGGPQRLGKLVGRTLVDHVDGVALAAQLGEGGDPSTEAAQAPDHGTAARAHCRTCAASSAA